MRPSLCFIVKVLSNKIGFVGGGVDEEIDQLSCLDSSD